MKKIALLLAVLLLVGGCVPIPSGVKSSLYTAQLTLKATVGDAVEGTNAPWNIPGDETTEAKLTRTEKQVILLLKTMEQADKNLTAVVEYFRTGKETQ